MNTNSYRNIYIFLFLSISVSCSNFKSDVSIVVSNGDKGKILINHLPMSSFVKRKYRDGDDAVYYLALPKERVTFKFILQDSSEITKTKEIQGEVYLGVDFETLEFQGFD